MTQSPTDTDPQEAVAEGLAQLIAKDPDFACGTTNRRRYIAHSLMGEVTNRALAILADRERNPS